MIKIWIYAFLFLGVISPLYGQLVEFPHPSLPQETRANIRTAADSSQLTLPFWDDFSATEYLPDTAKWVNSEHVTITNGIAIDPPTVNVAAFDGLNAFGSPHSGNPNSIDLGDSLVSRFINLEEADDPQSIYLSFYYQKEGLGELPDEKDFLRLMFKDRNNEWQEIWKVNGTDVNSSEEFFFEIIHVDEAMYAHEYFQFKFENNGRLSGHFDTWNVDYVYLNDERDATDQPIRDRALFSKPTSFLQVYSAIPYPHFISDPAGFLNISSVGVRNLNDVEQALRYYSILKFQGNDQVIDSLKKMNVFNLSPLSDTIVRTDELDPGIFDGLGDSLYLQTEFVLISNDSLIEDSIDPKVNDTVRSNVVIHETLSYDDGTAESSAGLSKRGDRLAYEYYTPVEDDITQVQIYFPSLAGNQEAKSFILYVWAQLEEERQLFRQEIPLIKAAGRNDFGTYQLLQPVTVNGTFYIGLEQTIDNFFLVGLDKNGNTGDKIFFDISGDWEQNTDLKGHLMLRPIFGEAPPVITGTGLPAGNEPISIYPNPFQSTFQIKGKWDDVHVYDMLGRLVDRRNGHHTNRIDLSDQPDGIYLVKIRNQGRTTTKKIIKK